MRDVLTVAHYFSKGDRPAPEDLMHAVQTVHRKNPSVKYGFLRDKHWQFVANQCPHLPLKGKSMDLFKKAVHQTFTSADYPIQKRVTGVGEQDSQEESDESSADSFTESDGDSSVEEESKMEEDDEE